VPNNTIANVADYQFDIARYCDVALSNPGPVTLDMNPTIETLWGADRGQGRAPIRDNLEKTVASVGSRVRREAPAGG
jgi:hypothetical protein